MARASTRFLMTTAAVGAAGGILLIPANNLAALVSDALPLVFAATVGLWVVPSIVALDLLRRPGASVLTSLFAGIVLIPFTPYGVRSVITCLIFGVLLEVPFAVTLYRRWARWLPFVAVTLLVGAYSFVAYRSYGVESFAPGAQVAFFALMVLSAWAFTAIALVVAARLRRAGVARGIGRRSAGNGAAASAGTVVEAADADAR